LTWLFVIKPDFTLATFLNQYGITAALPMPATGMIAIFALVTFIAAPVFNLIPSLGEELGWRGFLLPTLEPLGKTKAVIISGMIWALWHTPMILILGFAYGRQMWLGALLHFILVTGLGIWMGSIWLENHSTVLAAFIHSVFNANAYGVWTLLFVSNNKLLVGGTGLIITSFCFLLGIFTIYKLQQQVIPTAAVEGVI
jgi:membrane protease YdiL (CAAX protease family)